MPKQRQIPRLFPQPLADGGTAWHWKPSKTLREQGGFVNVKLGTDRRVAIGMAEDLNAAVDAWRAGSATAEAEAPRPRLPRIVRFPELVQRYKLSPEYTGLRANTRRDYDSKLRALEHWAGDLPVRDIDRPMALNLKKIVLQRSVFLATGWLRVLRLLLNWAKAEGIVAANVMDDVKIPDNPGRKTMMPERIREAIAEAAAELAMPDVLLGTELAFWTVQRQRDLLDLGRLAWRELQVPEESDPRHVATLADGKGRVMGFRLCQQKTGAWIDAPVPPMLHPAIEAAMRASNSGYLFPSPGDPSAAVSSSWFQHRFAEARDAAATVAICRDDPELAEAIWGVQFRDLRRTGMTYYGNAGANLKWITALSGHAVLGHKTILDKYMPGDTAGAIACVATGLRAFEAKQAREKLG